jgi:hypothetical protein
MPFFSILSVASREMMTTSCARDHSHFFELCCCSRRMMTMSYAHRRYLFFQHSSIASRETMTTSTIVAISLNLVIALGGQRR